MTARAAAALLLAVAVLCSCASAKPQRESGSADPPENSCLDNPAGRAYMQEVWRALQDAWVLPAGLEADQRAELIIPYDGAGNAGEPYVARDTNTALRLSVEKAIEGAELPPTPDELRACIAGKGISGVFRNTEATR